MVSKIKVKVKTEDKKINLPAIPISWLPFILKIAARAKVNASSKDGKEVDVDVDVMLRQVSALIKQAKPLLKHMEPFTMVEVQTDDAFVLIEMK